MAKTYAGASGAIQRMNAIIGLARGRKFVTVAEVYCQLKCSHKTAKSHLRALVESGHMKMLEPLFHNSERKFILNPGVKLLEVPAPVWGTRKSRAKPGAKKVRPRLHWPMEKDKMPRRVEIRPAEQIGIQRDPLTAALFGSYKLADERMVS